MEEDVDTTSITKWKWVLVWVQFNSIIFKGRNGDMQWCDGPMEANSMSRTDRLG